MGTECEQVHWARIIIDEGHELGGSGLTEMNKVLGAVLASATWVPTYLV